MPGILRGMDRPEETGVRILNRPVQYLKGVGPQRAELLARLGITTVKDVLFYFPRDYFDLTDYREITFLEEGKVQSVEGVVAAVECRTFPNGRSVLTVGITGKGGFLRGVWFNQPYLREQFQVGQRVVFSGKPRRAGLLWEMFHPMVQRLGEEEQPQRGLLPLYSLTQGLEQWELRRIVRAALEVGLPWVEDVFPEDYRQKHALLPIQEALRFIHFPPDATSLEKARRRFVYQELLVLQLALAIRRCQQQSFRKAPVLRVTREIDKRIRRLFPFEFTPGQNQAIAEICEDLAKPVPMLRLLHGDVGSGKTVVAAYAMLLAVAHGYQTALMTPTEVLARQHMATFERLLAHSRVRRVLLTGGLSPRERATVLAQIAAGEADLVIGTQALIQEDVQFHRLGLVIIDEQHKFGVRQRAALKASGEDPHYLVMSATPIPRTLTLTLFGDLDVSTIRDAPPGRQRVHTFLAEPDKRGQWWEFFREKLREGRQGYVVTPVIEESDELDLVSLEQAFESLANGELEAFRLGLMHGRLPAEQKQAIMHAFRTGEIQVLVCTSVIEVGIDVPNATLMAIENPERFGLAQLHQLRGRVSRGRYPGYCCLFPGPDLSEQARKRLEAFVRTTDGFELAEVDFALRGPGEIFGTRQHGFPPLRVADLTRDYAVLVEARRDAQQIVAADPGLANPQWALLRRQVLARYGKALDLAEVA
ncbi:MAG: ATP-dependent DNA helicase RecG [Thermoguttaceae bacterium]|nr:ATP-dependent DNA helicase RecG [Thermoguttaceae bacterium]MDW8079424.1 ATP-dependent DNA helicase RecG [Thermoguttaceae bacterium]